MGAMMLALQSTGVFSEDYLVGNRQTKEVFNHGQLGQFLQQFFTQAAATPARASARTIDSNPLSNKTEAAGRSAKPTQLTRRDLQLPNAFMGNILDLIQQEQEDAANPSPLAKHFSTRIAKWTTCVNCTCTWIEPEAQRCHIKLTVPVAPPLGPREVPLTDMFGDWTRGIQRRGEICPLCDQRSGTEDMQQLTEVRDVICIALDRYPRQQGPAQKTPPTTATSIALPPRDLDLGNFFHPDYHHEQGSQLFQLCAVICHDDGCDTTGTSFRLARFTTYTEHPACGGWFKHDLNRADPVNLLEALTSEEVRTRSVAAIYRRHEPTSPHSEDRRVGTPVDPRSPEGMWRLDELVGMPQVSPRPAPEKHRNAKKPLHTGSEAEAAAVRSARLLAEENRTADAKKGRHTAKPKAQAPAAASACVPPNDASIHHLLSILFKCGGLNIHGMRIKGDFSMDGCACIGLLHKIDFLCNQANLDAVFLQETWAKIDPPEFPSANYVWFFSPTNDIGRSGVCIGVHRKWVEGASSPKFTSVSDRIATVTMLIEGQKFAFVNAYFPAQSAKTLTANNRDGELTHAFIEDDLTSVVKDFIDEGYNVIVPCDANAQVGRPAADKDGLPDTSLGPCSSDPVCTQAGLHLIEFCHEHALSIEDTWHEPPPEGSGTWHNNRTEEGTYVNAIDHILVHLTETSKVEVKHCSVNRKFDAPSLRSDHLMTDIILSIPSQHPGGQPIDCGEETRSGTRPHRLKAARTHLHGDYKKLRLQPALAETLKAVLEVKVTELRRTHTDTSPEGRVKLHDDMCEIFRSTCAELLPREQGICPGVDKDWYAASAHTLDPLQHAQAEARKAFVQHVHGDAEQYEKVKSKWKEAGRVLDAAMVEARSAHYIARAKVSQTCFDIGDSQGFWAAASPNTAPRSSKGRMVDTAMRSGPSSTEFTSTPDECSQHWLDYAIRLLGTSQPRSPLWHDGLLPDQQPFNIALAYHFTSHEILVALKLMKYGKSVGGDGIPIEVMRLLYSAGARQIICDALNAMLDTASVPNEWKDVILVFIYKRFDKSLSTNYRGIGLMAHKGKLLERLIYNRLMPHALRVPGALDDVNFGFKGGLSQTDHLLVSRLITGAAMEHAIPVYQCWIDLIKAYDNVDWTILCAVIGRLGVPKKLVDLILALHVGARARVRIDGVLTKDDFELLRGLKQGSVFAPLLYLIYQGAIMMLCAKEFKRLKLGMKLVFTLDGDIVDTSDMDERTFFSKLFSSLGFADDMKLIAKSARDLQTMVNIFRYYCNIFGLDFNIPKCVCMVTHRILASEVALRQRRQDELVIVVAGQRLKVVTETITLGQVECDTNSIGPELA